MQGILKYDLTTEERDFRLAVNGYKWASVCWNLEDTL